MSKTRFVKKEILSFFLITLICLYQPTLCNLIQTHPPLNLTPIANIMIFYDYFFPPTGIYNFFVGDLGATPTIMSKNTSTGVRKFWILPALTRFSYVLQSAQNLNNYFMCFESDSKVREYSYDLSTTKLEHINSQVGNTATGLRCSAANDSSSYTMAYIGTNFLYTFTFSTLTYTQFYTFNKDEVIVEMLIISNRSVNQTFIIFTKNQILNYYTLYSMDFPSKVITLQKRYLFTQLNLLSNIRISINTLDNMIIIFSFDSSNFNYYFIDKITGAIRRAELSNYFAGLTGMHFKDVRFINNSEQFAFTLYFDINDNYFGVGDVLTNFYYYIQSMNNVDNIFTKKNSGVEYMVSIGLNRDSINFAECVFSRDSSNNCVVKCDSTQNLGYFYNGVNQKCENCITIFNSRYGKYCVTSCPLGLTADPTTGLCTKCTNVYSTATNQCTATCLPNSAVDSNNVCQKCSDQGLFYDNYLLSCVNTCSLYTIVDPVVMTCTTCQSLSKYYCGDTTSCCNTCPILYAPDSENICYLCKDKGLYYSFEEKICISTCPSYAVNDSINLTCEICKLKSTPQFYDPTTSTCVAECPVGYVPDSNNLCVSCASSSGYYNTFTKLCQLICDSSFNSIDIVNRICKPCFSFQQYLYSNSCVTSCPQYNTILVKNVCYSCKANNKFYDNSSGTCLTNCYSDQQKDIVLKTCTDCKVQGLYLYQNSCIAQCPKYSIALSNNNCYSCSTGGQYYSDPAHGCVNSCSSFMAKDDTLKVCTDCLAKNMFLYNNTCVSSCPQHTIVQAKNVCFSCKDKNQYVYNNTCVNACPKGYGVLPNNVCYSCKSLNNFYLDVNNVLNSKCVEQCPDYSAIDLTTNYCQSCINYDSWLFNNKCITECKYCKSENNKCNYCNECDELGLNKDLRLNKCVNGCTKGSVLNSKNECEYCLDTPNTKFYFNNTCLTECPERHTPDNNYICNSCDGFVYNRKCLNNCPAEMGIDENNTNDLCYLCADKNKYLNGNICVTSCPNNTISIEQFKLCSPVLSCLNNCNNKGNCNTTNSTCVCDAGFTGSSCELREHEKNNLYTIVNLRPIVQTDYNIFKIKFLNEKDLKNNNLTLPTNYTLYWNIDTIPSENYYLNGRGEEIIKVSPFSLSSGKNNISLILVDLYNNINYTSTYEVDISELNKDKFILDYTYANKSDNLNYGVSFETVVNLAVRINHMNRILQSEFNTTKFEVNNFKYKFYFIDDFNREIALTNAFQNSNIFSSIFPQTNTVMVMIQDNSQQTVKVTSSIDIRFNPKLKNLTTSEILNNSNISDAIKLALLNDYILNKENVLNLSDIISLSNYLQSTLSTFLKDPEMFPDHTSILSVFDKITKNQLLNTDNNEKLNSLNHLTNLLQNFTLKLDGVKNQYAIEKNTILSYYISSDTIYNVLDSGFSFKNSFNETQNIKNSITNVNNYFSKSLVNNENVQISTQNFGISLQKFSTNNNNLVFNYTFPNSTFNSFDDYSIKNNIINSGSSQVVDTNLNGGSDTLLNIDSTNFNLLKSHLSVNESNYLDTTISTIFIKSSDNQVENQNLTLMTPQVITNFHNSANGKIVENNDFFKYEISLKMKNSTSINITKNAACVSLDSIAEPSTKCSTFYNYTSSIVICKCRGTGTIGNIFDYTFSNIAKLFQFPDWSLELLNPLSISIVYSTLFILIIFSLVLLISDYIDDNKVILLNDANDHKVIRNHFGNVMNFCNTNILSFALYITLYVFPFFSIFHVHHYNQPRFLRFLLEILSLTINMCLTLLPYYKTPFTYADVFKDERNIEYEGWSIDNLPTQLSDVASTYIYSTLTSIITVLILLIFKFLMKWENTTVNIWKHRKDILHNYIAKYYVKPISNTKNWVRLRTRIIAYVKLCVVLFLNNPKIEQENDNFSITNEPKKSSNFLI